MIDSDLTLSILREIRDAVVTTNARIDDTNVELRAMKSELGEMKSELRVTNERLDITNERLAVVENTVKDAAGQIVMLARYVKNKHETAMDDLRERVTRLEAKASG